jgi:hypothetical protein
VNHADGLCWLAKSNHPSLGLRAHQVLPHQLRRMRRMRRS